MVGNWGTGIFAFTLLRCIGSDFCLLVVRALVLSKKGLFEKMTTVHPKVVCESKLPKKSRDKFIAQMEFG